MKIRLSTVAAGTSYEQLSVEHLRALFFHLSRVGGRDDRGIDLLGLWRPPSGDPIRTIVQCKAHAAPPQPSWLRALEGAFAGAPPEWHGPNTIGVLVAKGRATEGIRQGLLSAQRGLMWVQLGEETRIGQVLWNARVRELIGSNVGSGIVYQRDPTGQLQSHVRLTREGQLWTNSNV